MAAKYATKFRDFIDDLVGTGYRINYFGGYRKSEVDGTDKASWHSSGAAIDINPGTNPMYKYKEGEVGPDTPGAKPLGRDGRWIITDMPDNIYEIAQKHGLGWGGKWGSTIDAMHFSVAKGEGGSVSTDVLKRGVVPVFSGNFQTGGMIPKGKVGLAGESGPESVKGTMLDGPTLVSGGEKGTRVRRETPSRNDMMSSLSSALGEAPPDPRDIPRGPYNPPSDPSTADQPKWFSKSPFFKDIPNPWWKNELFDNIPAGPPSGIPEDSGGYPIIVKQLKRRRETAKKAVGWDIGPLTKGMLWAAKTMMSRTREAHEKLGFNAGPLSKGNLWRATVMQKREAAGGTKGQIWAAKTEAKRAGDSENWKNYIRETVMVDTGHHAMMKESFQYKNPEAPRNDTALQQAGQMSTVVVTNQTNVQNISTASSTSNQKSVGSTQQSIPITNMNPAPSY